MSTARLAALRPALRATTSRNASTASGANVWKEINRLASEGKWDNINNTPKMFLTGAAKKETYAAWAAINHSADVFAQSPYGQFAKVAFRIIALLSIIKAGVVTYEFVVPEHKRLHYKHRHHGHHGDHHAEEHH